MRARGGRGMTLLEVLVAVVVLATGIVALQKLVVRSTAGIASDVQLTRSMLRARALLADAEVQVPSVGHVEGAVPGETDLRWERDVSDTPHRSLRQVRVRVAGADGHDAAELVELIRVPTN